METHDMKIYLNLGRMLRPQSGQWMTLKIIVEMKNAPNDPNGINDYGMTTPGVLYFNMRLYPPTPNFMY